MRAARTVCSPTAYSGKLAHYFRAKGVHHLHWKVGHAFHVGRDGAIHQTIPKDIHRVGAKDAPGRTHAPGRSPTSPSLPSFDLAVEVQIQPSPRWFHCRLQELSKSSVQRTRSADFPLARCVRSTTVRRWPCVPWLPEKFQLPDGLRALLNRMWLQRQHQN